MGENDHDKVTPVRCQICNMIGGHHVRCPFHSPDVSHETPVDAALENVKKVNVAARNYIMDTYDLDAIPNKPMFDYQDMISAFWAGRIWTHENER